MKSLVDVNVLLPLFIEGHPLRKSASRWWEDQADGSVVICLPVRMALLRHLTNPGIMKAGVLTPEDAWSYVHRFSSDARVVASNDSPPGIDAYWLANVTGRKPSPNLWTDAWLAAFAEATGLDMVTFDAGFKDFTTRRLRLLRA